MQSPVDSEGIGSPLRTSNGELHEDREDPLLFPGRAIREDISTRDEIPDCSDCDPSLPLKPSQYGLAHQHDGYLDLRISSAVQEEVDGESELKRDEKRQKEGDEQEEQNEVEEEQGKQDKQEWQTKEDEEEDELEKKDAEWEDWIVSQLHVEGKWHMPARVGEAPPRVLLRALRSDVLGETLQFVAVLNREVRPGVRETAWDWALTRMPQAARMVQAVNLGVHYMLRAVRCCAGILFQLLMLLLGGSASETISAVVGEPISVADDVRGLDRLGWLALCATSASVALGTGCGIVGCAAGGAIGIACGIPIMFMTLGFSLLVGSIGGAVVGLCIGGLLGGLVGCAGGSVMGYYQVRRKRLNVVHS